MQSPVSSPYSQHSKQTFSSQRPFYPTTPQPEPSGLESAQNRGLGLFECTLAPSQSTVNALPPSPQPSDGWSHSSMMDQDFPQSSQPPDIFTAAYDPFSGFSAASNTGMVSGPSPEAPGLVYCHTPSHRSSVSSSCTATEAYAHNGSGSLYIPKVKVEDATEWYPSPGHGPIIHRTLTTQGLSDYSNDISPASAAPTEDFYRTSADEWSKPAVSGYPIDLHSTDDTHVAKFDHTPIVPSLTRTKKKRQRTTPDEATHECRVCGKLFKRSYNWKSHLETHNPERKYPHPCTKKAGDALCTKKFQRKTDLDRHVASVSFAHRGFMGDADVNRQVHLKARNYKCSLCDHGFARRDTLRRHTEDGCPKRFDLGFREGSAATPARWSFANFPAKSRSYSAGPYQSSLMIP